MTDAEWKAWCDQPGTDVFGFPWSSWHRTETCECSGCAHKRAHRPAAITQQAAAPQAKSRGRVPRALTVIDFASRAAAQQGDLFA